MKLKLLFVIVVLVISGPGILAASKMSAKDKTFLDYFKIEKKSTRKKIVQMVSLLKKRQSQLEKKSPNLAPAEKKELVGIRDELSLITRGYNPYRMTDQERGHAIALILKYEKNMKKKRKKRSKKRRSKKSKRRKSRK